MAASFDDAFKRKLSKERRPRISRRAHGSASCARFINVDSIAPGLDFVGVLDERVAQCDVPLAVIGASPINLLLSIEAGGRFNLRQSFTAAPYSPSHPRRSPRHA